MVNPDTLRPALEDSPNILSRWSCIPNRDAVAHEAEVMHSARDRFNSHI